MSLTSMFKTDNTAENKGFAASYGPHEKSGKEIKIFLAYAGKTNAKYQKTIRRLTKPVERLIQNESLTDEQSEALYKQAFAEACVTGWEEVYISDIRELKKDEKDALADFTPENAIALFNRLPHLYDDLVARATKISNYKTLAQEDEAKN